MLIDKPHRAPRPRASTRSVLVAAARCAMEPLERRALMCGIDALPLPDSDRSRASAGAAGEAGTASSALIVWDNEGSATNDSDFFNFVFGSPADAELARGVVRGVIRAFEDMILDFNYDHMPIDESYHLHLEMGQMGFGAGSGITQVWDDKPKAGFVIVGGGDSSPRRGWFLDPTPDEHSEFDGPILNAFAGEAISGDARNRPDFYSVVAHEIAHCLGVNNLARWNAMGRVTNPPIADTAPGQGAGKFWTFSGPSVQHLMTSFNGGIDQGSPVHTASALDAAGQPISVTINNVAWRGAADLGNAVAGPSGRRYLIPDTLNLMLRDAYGYTTRSAGAGPTFHAIHKPNTTVPTLLIRGGAVSSGSDDVITLGRSGSMITVSVDVGNDVPGTGALPGTGNLPAYTATFDSSEFSRIEINGLDGDDTININGVFAGKTVDVFGSFGNDTVHLTPVGHNLDLISGTLVLRGHQDVGMADVDTLIVHDAGHVHHDTFDITATTLRRTIVPTMTIDGFEVTRIEAGGGDNTFNVTGRAAGTSLNILAGGGDDVINVGGAVGGNVDNVDGSVVFNGEGDSNTFNYNDALNPANGQTYTLTSLAATRTGSGLVTFANAQTVNLNAGAGANTVNVNSTVAASATTINANGGADTVNVGPSAAILLTVNGGDANDTINLDDPAGLSNFVVINGDAGTDDTLNYNAQNRTTNDAYTINSGAIDRTGAVTVFHGTFEDVVVNAGIRADSFDVETTSAGTTYTLNGGAGNDSLDVTLSAGHLGNADGPIVFNGGADADTASLFDNVNTANDLYTITSSTVTRSGFGGLTCGTIEGLALTASSGHNGIDINSMTAGTPLTLNGGNGNDAFNVNTPPLAAIQVNGQAHTGTTGDSLVVNGNAFANASYTPSGTTPGSGGVSYNGRVISFTGIEPVTAERFLTFTMFTPNGNDVVDVDAPLSGRNRLSGTSGGVAFQPLTFRNVANFVLNTGLNDAASRDDALRVNQALAATGLNSFRFIGGVGNDALTVGAGTFTFAANAALDTQNLSINVGAANVVFNATQHIASLSLGAGSLARLSAGANKVLVTRAFSNATGLGRLDLADNDMILDYTGPSPLAAVQSQVAGGYNGGLWTGNGINSSSAAASAGSTGIGVVLSTDLFSTFPAPFAGQSVDNTAVLLSYTAYGDTNLDGTVNLADFNRLAANFGQANRRWFNGNFDFDTDVDLADFNRLAANFGTIAFLPPAERR